MLTAAICLISISLFSQTQARPYQTAVDSNVSTLSDVCTEFTTSCQKHCLENSWTNIKENNCFVSEAELNVSCVCNDNDCTDDIRKVLEDKGVDLNSVPPADKYEPTVTPSSVDDSAEDCEPTTTIVYFKPSATVGSLDIADEYKDDSSVAPANIEGETTTVQYGSDPSVTPTDIKPPKVYTKKYYVAEPSSSVTPPKKYTTKTYDAPEPTVTPTDIGGKPPKVYTKKYFVPEPSSSVTPSEVDNEYPPKKYTTKTYDTPEPTVAPTDIGGKPPKVYTKKYFVAEPSSSVTPSEVNNEYPPKKYTTKTYNAPEPTVTPSSVDDCDSSESDEPVDPSSLKKKVWSHNVCNFTTSILNVTADGVTIGYNVAGDVPILEWRTLVSYQRDMILESKTKKAISVIFGAVKTTSSSWGFHSKSALKENEVYSFQATFSRFSDVNRVPRLLEVECRYYADN